MVVDDFAGYSGDDSILLKLKEIGTRSAIVCTYSGNNASGFACFEVHRNSVRWSNETVTALRLVSKFIAAYLSNLKNYFELVKKDAKSKTHDEVTGLPKLEIFKKNHWNTLIPKRKGNWLLPALILPILIRLTVFMEGQWEIPFLGNLPKNMPK